MAVPHHQYRRTRTGLLQPGLPPGSKLHNYKILAVRGRVAGRELVPGEFRIEMAMTARITVTAAAVSGRPYLGVV
jgi:hypothetical protein